MIRVILDTIVSKDTVQIYINNSKKKKNIFRKFTVWIIISTFYIKSTIQMIKLLVISFYI